MSGPAHLYTPPDLDEAAARWKACCGHGALAAILRCPVMYLRRAFPWAPREPWTSPKRLRLALEHLGVQVGRDALFSREWPRHPFPPHGLVFVQFEGPWLDPGVPVKEAYARTHLAASSTVNGARYIYDVNVEPAGGWVPEEVWRRDILPPLAAHYHGATGGIRIRFGVHVLRVPSIAPDGPMLALPVEAKGPQLGLFGPRS